MLPPSSGLTIDITHMPRESFHNALTGPNMVTHAAIMMDINKLKIIKSREIAVWVETLTVTVEETNALIFEGRDGKKNIQTCRKRRKLENKNKQGGNRLLQDADNGKFIKSF